MTESLHRRDVLRGLATAGIALATGGAAAGVPASQGIIDVHAHVAVPAYLALLAQAGVRPSGYAGSSRTPTSGGAGGDSAAAIAARIAMMDRAGVSKQILSASLAPYLADAAKAVRRCDGLMIRAFHLCPGHGVRVADAYC